MPDDVKPLADPKRDPTVRSDGRPSVTVVVPTKNAARTPAACLSSIRAQTYPCRSVVVDDPSSDASVEIATEMADVLLHAGPERSAQRNHGARSQPRDIVGFNDADMVLEPTVVAQAVDAVCHGAGSVVAPERAIGSGFWVSIRAFKRFFCDGCYAIQAARFFGRDVFERTCGFDEALTGSLLVLHPDPFKRTLCTGGYYGSDGFLTGMVRRSVVGPAGKVYRAASHVFIDGGNRSLRLLLPSRDDGRRTTGRSLVPVGLGLVLMVLRVPLLFGAAHHGAGRSLTPIVAAGMQDVHRGATIFAKTAGGPLSLLRRTRRQRVNGVA